MSDAHRQDRGDPGQEVEAAQADKWKFTGQRDGTAEVLTRRWIGVDCGLSAIQSAG
jgi:hypothetical protein